SLPDNPNEADAMARFCGLTILPRKPPEEFAAAMSTRSSPRLVAACTCSEPNSEFDDVSDPVTATPIHPRMGEISAKAPPDPASQTRSDVVWPDRFITQERPRHPRQVMNAQCGSTMAAT